MRSDKSIYKYSIIIYLKFLLTIYGRGYKYTVIIESLTCLYVYSTLHYIDNGRPIDKHEPVTRTYDVRTGVPIVICMYVWGAGVIVSDAHKSGSIDNGTCDGRLWLLVSRIQVWSLLWANFPTTSSSSISHRHIQVRYIRYLSHIHVLT